MQTITALPCFLERCIAESGLHGSCARDIVPFHLLDAQFIASMTNDYSQIPKKLIAQRFGAI